MYGLGFNIKSSNNMYMAQLANDEMVWSYSGRYSDNLKTWEELKSYIESNGYGLYFLGLSKSWGHVQFLIYRPDGMVLLHHTGPSPRGTFVMYDDAESYIKEWMQPDLIHAGKLDSGLVVKWLTDEPIYPVKTRSYHWEEAGSNTRVVDAQKMLQKLGYFIGEIDCVYGPETRSAILKFQLEKNLHQTMLPDDETLNLLRSIVNNLE